MTKYHLWNANKREIFYFTFASFFLAVIILVPSKILAPRFWPREIENEAAFTALFQFLNHEIIFILANLFFYAVYHVESDVFEQYKVESEPWPWKEDRGKWIIQLKKTAKLIMFNQFVIIPGFLFLTYLSKKTLVRTDYESLPGINEIGWQLLFIYCCDDFFFYWSHRILHWKGIYSSIHKIHHEHKITVALAAEYAHPLEFLFGNIFPVNVGVMLLGKRAHLLTLGIYTFYKIIQTTHGHSGYQFPFLPNAVVYSIFPGLSKPEFHSYHHLRFTGNYGGGLVLWDHVFNTNHPKYFDELKARKNKRKLD
jgi:sterol desaturase/sphingolipid hydroxylase (fatty acid hydroxylase superfamily)